MSGKLRRGEGETVFLDEARAPFLVFDLLAVPGLFLR